MEPEVIELLQWSASQMKWERELATQHGTPLPRVRGIRKLNQTVLSVLTKTKATPARRGQLAARLIEKHVRESYRQVGTR